jgi:sacsin
VTDGIRDTLERYPKELTLHEYLANADDCESASEVNWLLDETTYPGRSLITPELANYQGPSLLVHNDGGM